MLKWVLSEDAIVQCEHGGTVQFTASQRAWRIEDVPLLVIDDLQDAPITGCTLSHKDGGPCTKVAVVPASCGACNSHTFGHAHLIRVAGALTDKGSELTIKKAGQRRYDVSELQTKNPQEEVIEKGQYRLYLAWQQPKVSNDEGENLVAPRVSTNMGDLLYRTSDDDDGFPVFADNDSRVSTGLNSYVHLNIDGDQQSYQLFGEDGMPLYQNVKEKGKEQPKRTRCLVLPKAPTDLAIAFTHHETPPAPSGFMKIERSYPFDDFTPLPYMRINMRLPLKKRIVDADNLGALLEDNDKGTDLLVVIEPSVFEQLLYRQQRQRQQFMAAVTQNRYFFDKIQQGHAHAYTSLNLVDNAYQTEKQRATVQQVRDNLSTLRDQFNVDGFIHWLKERSGNNNEWEKKKFSNTTGNPFYLVKCYLNFDAVLSSAQRYQWRQLIPVQGALDIQQHFLESTKGFRPLLSDDSFKETWDLVLACYDLSPSLYIIHLTLPPEIKSQAQQGSEKKEPDTDASLKELALIDDKIRAYSLLMGVLYEFYQATNQEENLSLVKQIVQGFSAYNHIGVVASHISDAVINTVDNNEHGNKNLKQELDPEAVGLAPKAGFLHQYRDLINTQQQLAYDPPKEAYQVADAMDNPEEKFGALSRLLPSDNNKALATELFGEFEFYCQQPTLRDKADKACLINKEAEPIEFKVPYLANVKPELDESSIPMTEHGSLHAMLGNYVSVTPAKIGEGIATLLQDKQIAALFTEHVNKLNACATASKQAMEDQLFESIAIVLPFIRPVTQVTEDLATYWKNNIDSDYLKGMVQLLSAVRALDTHYWQKVSEESPKEESKLLSKEKTALYHSYLHYVMQWVFCTYLDEDNRPLLQGFLPELVMIKEVDFTDPVVANKKILSALVNVSYLLKTATGGKMGELATLLGLDAKSSTNTSSTGFGGAADTSTKLESSNLLKNKWLKTFIKSIPTIEAYSVLFYNLVSWLNKSEEEKANVSVSEVLAMAQGTFAGLVVISSQKAVQGTVLKYTGFKVTKNLIKSQRYLNRVLNLRAMLMIGNVLTVINDLDSTLEDDHASKERYLLIGIINMLILLSPIRIVPQIVLGVLNNIGLRMFWADKYKDSPLSRFVKKSLWYQEMPLIVDFAEHTKAMITFDNDKLKAIDSDGKYSAYLQESLATKYPDQQPWEQESDESGEVASINKTAFPKWQTPEKWADFENAKSLTDFLFANYIDPRQTVDKSEAEVLSDEANINHANRRYHRLLDALHHELRGWSTLDDPYHIEQHKENNGVYFTLSDGLVNDLKCVTVQLQNQQGEWAKTVVEKPFGASMSKKVFGLERQNPTSSQGIKEGKWVKRVVLIGELSPPQGKSDGQEWVCFDSQGTIQEVDDMGRKPSHQKLVYNTYQPVYFKMNQMTWRNNLTLESQYELPAEIQAVYQDPNIVTCKFPSSYVYQAQWWFTESTFEKVECDLSKYN